jgi:hypothetical protein
MTTPNSIPLPNGHGFTATNLPQSFTTQNFTVNEPGTYAIVVNMLDNPDPNLPPKVQLQSVNSAGTATVVLTFYNQEYIPYAVGPGSSTFNFTTTSGAKSVAFVKLAATYNS